jgi:site-specific DNA recombinase
MRAVLYARYSTGNQSPLSIDDQLRLCRPRPRSSARTSCASSPTPRSAASTAPGRAERAARLRAAGGCDVVIAEHSNRLARDGETAGTSSTSSAAWACATSRSRKARSPSSTRASRPGLGAEGRGGAPRTRRGLRPWRPAGTAGLTYGYRKKRLYDERRRADPGPLEIDEAQAASCGGSSATTRPGEPLAIAAALNAEGVPGPRGGLWNDTTIGGNAARGNGHHAQRALPRRAGLGPP